MPGHPAGDIKTVRLLRLSPLECATQAACDRIPTSSENLLLTVRLKI